MLCGLCVRRACSVANGVIANAPGRYESTVAGAPMRSCPISAPSRASSVESCSGVGCARVNSVCCSTRPGVGSMTMVTRSIGGGRRMRFEIEQRERPQRPHVAHRRRQLQPPRVHVSRVTSRSTTCSTAAPRSRRSRRVDSGSSSRVSTNDSGSSPSIGHSSSIDDSNRSSASVGTSGRTSSPRAIACHTSAGAPEPRDQIGGGQRRQLAERLQAPTV